jgi:hypothetical protein
MQRTPEAEQPSVTRSGWEGAPLGGATQRLMRLPAVHRQVKVAPPEDELGELRGTLFTAWKF